MQEDLYITLLYKQLAGEILPAEAAQLQEWRQADPEHEAEAQAVELAWQVTAPEAVPQTVDLDAAFAELSQQMDISPPAKAKVRSIRPNWLAMVAALTLLLVAVFLLRPQNGGNQEIAWAQVEATNEDQTIILADQSQVHLQAGSRLDYPTSMESGSRRVKLSGAAFFEVSHNPGQPFIVETATEEIRVLGTSFLVQAPTDADQTYVYVQTGRVAVEVKQGTASTILTAGQAASANRQTNAIINEPVASPNVLSWHSGKLYFEQKELASTLADIEEKLGITIQLNNPALANCPLDAVADRQQIEAFLESLTAIFEVELATLPDGTYQISGGQCP